MVELLGGPAAAQVADDLLATFGSLGGAVGADFEAVAAAAGSEAATRLKAVAGCLAHMLAASVRDRPLLGNMPQLVDYLTVTASYAPVERVRALFLNARLELIRDEVVGLGCVSEAPIYVRPILKRALDLGATAVILVHNHPSGDPTPSDADVAITHALEEGLEAIGVRLVDHVVVAQGQWVSLRAEALL